MKLTYAPRAVKDLTMIGNYLAERSPSGAAAVEQRIHTVANLIAHFPATGRRIEARPEVSVFPLGTYPYNLLHHVPRRVDRSTYPAQLSGAH